MAYDMNTMAAVSAMVRMDTLHLAAGERMTPRYLKSANSFLFHMWMLSWSHVA